MTPLDRDGWVAREYRAPRYPNTTVTCLCVNDTVCERTNPRLKKVLAHWPMPHKVDPLWLREGQWN